MHATVKLKWLKWHWLGRGKGLHARPTWEDAVAAVRLVRVDKKLQVAIQRADGARDAKDFGLALSLYLDVLASAPLHGGYRVQVGHCLKELGYCEDAEIQYRDALVLGQPYRDVGEHLAYVAKKGGWHHPPFARDIVSLLSDDSCEAEGVSKHPFELGMVCGGDIEDSLRTLLEYPDVSSSRVLYWLRRYPFFDEFLAALVKTPCFLIDNADVMRRNSASWL